MKITEYPTIAEFQADNVLLTDGSTGTKTISIDDAFYSMIHAASIKNHRVVLRNKYLGDRVTTEQKASIQDGTFKDLYVGDYWLINDIAWRIADINYWMNTGDSKLSANHLVIVPDTCLYTSKMNATNDTTGGYVGSEMYTTNLAAAKTTIKSIFGENLLTHRSHLVNAVTNGRPSGSAWFDSEVELMNSYMVFGHSGYSVANDGVTELAMNTINTTQLALFNLCPEYIGIRSTYWLSDVASSTRFAAVGLSRVMGMYYASNSFGVRPVFAIG